MKACSSGSCVEVTLTGDRVVVSDSKLGEDSPVIQYSAAWWADRVAAMKRIHEAGWQWLPSGVHREPNGYSWHRDRVTLRFTVEEWDAFAAGVVAGQFDIDRLAVAGG